MKTLYSFFFSLAAIATVNGQAVPNGSFELWGAGEPISWVTANIVSANSTTKSTVAYLDSFAIKMETKALAFNPFPGIIPDTVPGLAILSANQNISQRTGIPYVARPATFTFYYKYAPVGNDTGFAYVRLSKWNPNTMHSDSVGEGGAFLNAAPNYTMGTSPIIYYSADIPDTLTIILASSRGATFGGYPAVPGSILYADNVSLTGGTVGMKDAFAGNTMYAFPNPATDKISFVTNSIGLNSTTLVIFDAIGNKVEEQLFNSTHLDLNTSNYPQGIYFYHLENSSNTITANGKFNIIK
jgi:hypothetical protein